MLRVDKRKKNLRSSYFAGSYYTGPKLTPALTPYWRYFLNGHGQTLIEKLITPALLTPYHQK